MQAAGSETRVLSNLFLLLLLATPPVGVEPEELLLALLVAHHLLRPGGGAAHEARHGGALGLGDDPVGGTIGPGLLVSSDWMRSQVTLLLGLVPTAITWARPAPDGRSGLSGMLAVY